MALIVTLPEPGKTYKTKNQGTVRCLKSWREFDGTTVAILENVHSGWTVEAHGIRQETRLGNLIWRYEKGGHIKTYFEGYAE